MRVEASAPRAQARWPTDDELPFVGQPARGRRFRPRVDGFGLPEPRWERSVIVERRSKPRGLSRTEPKPRIRFDGQQQSCAIWVQKQITKHILQRIHGAYAMLEKIPLPAQPRRLQRRASFGLQAAHHLPDGERAGDDAQHMQMVGHDDRRLEHERRSAFQGENLLLNRSSGGGMIQAGGATLGAKRQEVGSAGYRDSISTERFVAASWFHEQGANGAGEVRAIVLTSRLEGGLRWSARLRARPERAQARWPTKTKTRRAVFPSPRSPPALLERHPRVRLQVLRNRGREGFAEFRALLFAHPGDAFHL